MRRAVTIIGRFAFGGWVLGTGFIVLVSVIWGVLRGFSRFTSDWGEAVAVLLLYSLLGLVGGAVVGIIAAVLDRLIKRPAGRAGSEAAPSDPGVWPPAPKSPH